MKDTVAQAQYEAMDDFLNAKFANVSLRNEFYQIKWGQTLEFDLWFRVKTH